MYRSIDVMTIYQIYIVRIYYDFFKDWKNFKRYSTFKFLCCRLTIYQKVNVISLVCVLQYFIVIWYVYLEMVCVLKMHVIALERYNIDGQSLVIIFLLILCWNISRVLNQIEIDWRYVILNSQIGKKIFKCVLLIKLFFSVDV